MAREAAQKSSGMVHIYSTLANPQKIVVWSKPTDLGMLPEMECEVLIRGGAGIASKNLITPQGVHTAITQEEYDAIAEVPHFKNFVESGHFRVERKEYDLDKIVSDMNPRDAGGPLTPADFEKTAKDGSAPIPVDRDEIGTGWVSKQLTNR
jgi:hypothetical protein